MSLNGAALSVINSRMEGVCRQMSNTLLRTGRSGVLNRARDFSCCVVTADCALLAAPDCLPIHVLSGPDIMARAMRDFHPNLQRGDAFLHNSPYHGCSHAADHTILMPVIDDEGVHRFTVLAKAHQADVGNSQPNTYFASARDVYEEGALIFPAVKVQSDYEVNADIVRMCRLRIRVPDQWYGDFLAVLGAARIGERQMRALAQDVGWDTLDQFARQWFDYSEARMRTQIAALPAVSAFAGVTHDPMPGTPAEGIQLRATVSVDPAVESITVDLRDNPDALPCGLNLSEACARTAALIGVFNSLDHSIPKNAGSMRRLAVLLRENCVAGIPRHPTSCSVATTNVADRVSAAVQLAMAAIPGTLGIAEMGPNQPACRATISGPDPRHGGRPFVNQIFLGASGGAGSALADGWQTYGHVGNGGVAFLDSVEQDELLYPLRVLRRELVPDSEGAGRFRGAFSTRVAYEMANAPVTIAFSTDGIQHRPRGAQGGGDGGGARNQRRAGDGKASELPASTTTLIGANETVISTTCAGGGYGPPWERDPARVAGEVEDELISRGRAEHVYGVVLAEDGSLDLDRTRERRAELLAAQREVAMAVPSRPVAAGSAGVQQRPGSGEA